MSKANVAIIGFGGIARNHYTAYHNLALAGHPIRVVAVVEKNALQLKNVSAINLGGVNVPLANDIHIYSDIEEMLEYEEVDAVDICLPTYLHKDVAITCLRAGKHVLCEKPMALDPEDCLEMVRTAEECGKRLMIGQCLRFDPAYRYLRECVGSGRLGQIRYLSLDRISEYPAWSAGSWLSNKSMGGGCIIDTHIHDIDVARFILGEPTSVSCIAYDHIPNCQLVSSRLFYNGVTVIARGDWDATRPIPFYMGYEARFEHAAVTFDGEKVILHRYGKPAEQVILPCVDRMEEELKYFAQLVMDPEIENDINSPESAAKSVGLVCTLRESANNNGKEIFI